MKIQGLLLMAGLAAAHSGLAQSNSESLIVDVGACVAFATSVERFVCYEEQVKAAQARSGVTKATASRQPVLSVQRSSASDSVAQDNASNKAMVAKSRTMAEVMPENETTVADFGLNDSSASIAMKDGIEELHSSISAFRELKPNQYLITLANGQVWRQMHPERYGLKEGQAVRVYPTKWGSAYRMTVPELRGFIQVERVK